MNVRHSSGILHSFSIKNIFYDKMDLSVPYFRVTICRAQILGLKYHDGVFLQINSPLSFIAFARSSLREI